MKYFILLAIIALSPTCILAQEANSQIKFQTESIDYGSIEKGNTGLRVFMFENNGDAPLIITNVKSSCGCTIPKKPEAPIAPGEKGEIQVNYDTNRLGVFRKTITVSTNDANSPIIALKIGGTVLAKE
tara:strand:- start:1070 stop:1453 length:384 start_codon:yes stop_codon:yes gene_type:complete